MRYSLYLLNWNCLNHPCSSTSACHRHTCGGFGWLNCCICLVSAKMCYRGHDISCNVLLLFDNEMKSFQNNFVVSLVPDAFDLMEYYSKYMYSLIRFDMPYEKSNMDWIMLSTFGWITKFSVENSSLFRSTSISCNQRVSRFPFLSLRSSNRPRDDDIIYVIFDAHKIIEWCRISEMKKSVNHKLSKK